MIQVRAARAADHDPAYIQSLIVKVGRGFPGLGGKVVCRLRESNPSMASISTRPTAILSIAKSKDFQNGSAVLCVGESSLSADAHR